MGLFDSLLGLQTADAQTAAAQAGMNQIGSAAAQNDGILRNQTNNANQALQTGAANATGAINSAYGNAQNTLANYGNQAQSTLGRAIQNATGTILGSNANYTPYLASGGAANTMQANALGLNGASGNAAATGAFQASPGYQFQVDQATQNAARQAASLGIAGSGNTLDAITRLGSNLANTEYGNWLSNLGGLGTQGLSAANSVSSNNQAAGNVMSTGGQTAAQLSQQLGGGLATLGASQGNALAGIQTGLGSGLSNNYGALGTNLSNTNMGSALAQANLGMQSAAAQDKASSSNNGIFSSLFGAGLNALKL